MTLRPDLVTSIAPDPEVVRGWQFVATMQPWVGLEVLLRHGEIHEGIGTLPPIISRNCDEGIWIVKTRTFRELGIDIDEPVQTMASAIGPIPIDGGDFLPFLIALRHWVEKEQASHSGFMKVLRNPSWQEFIEKIGGEQYILSKFNACL